MQLWIRASTRFPLAGVDWPRKLLIGGATGLLLQLVFVGLTYLTSEVAAFEIAPLVVGLNFPALGYILQVYRGTLRWEVGALPEWENWPALLRSGLAAFGVGLAYEILPLLILVVGLSVLVKGGVFLFLGMVLMILGSGRSSCCSSCPWPGQVSASAGSSRLPSRHPVGGINTSCQVVSLPAEA
jgi:hypothetical protein